MSTIERAIEKLSRERQQEQPPEPISAEASPPVEEPSARLPEPPDDGAGVPEPTVSPVHLDLSRLSVEGMLNLHAEQGDPLAEQFRRIKRPLLQNAQGKGAAQVEHPNLIMITSSLAGEGKTFTAINLALSIAMEMDKTVLLVDADVPNPQVTRRLGVKVERGLTDVLTDADVELKDVLVRTDIPNLTLLPAGRRHPRANELLASAGMHNLIEELATRYADRVVIFDSPPLILTSEARGLAGLMGQSVLVVEESRTPQPVLKDALGMLESSGIVGLVLNKTHRRLGAGYYGGYYGYGQ